MNKNVLPPKYIGDISTGDREVLGAAIGLAKTCGNNPYTDDTIKLICDVLLEFDRGCDGTRAAELVRKLHNEKHKVSPSCAVCQARCGNTDDYDVSLILDEEKEKLDMKQELISHAVQLAKAADKNTQLYADDEYRLVLLGVLTVLSYDMSLKGLENAAGQAEKWEVL